MMQQKILKVLNPILALLVVCQLTTGLCSDLIPDGLFIPIHLGGAILLALAAVTHLALNFNWVKAAYFTRRPGSTPS